MAKITSSRFTVGEMVQTPFGKGVVREVRNSNRLLVEVKGAALVVKDNEVSALTSSRKRSREPRASDVDAQSIRPTRESHTMSAEIDLHGLTVEQALDRVQQALNEAMLAGADNFGIRRLGGHRVNLNAERCARLIVSREEAWFMTRDQSLDGMRSKV